MTHPPKALPREFYEEPPPPTAERQRRSRRLANPDGFFPPMLQEQIRVFIGKISLGMTLGDKAFFDRAEMLLRQLREYTDSLRADPSEVWLVEVIRLDDAEKVSEKFRVTTLGDLCAKATLDDLADMRGIEMESKERLVAAAKEHGLEWRQQVFKRREADVKRDCRK